MRFCTIFILFITAMLSALALFESATYSGSVLGFFHGREYSEEGLAGAENYIPPRPITRIPGNAPRDFFESVEDLSICQHRDVRRFMYLYLTRDREYVKASIVRSRAYLSSIFELIGNTGGLPRDLSLLPLLESGFNPMAVSKSGAVGLWQFIRATSSILGLKTDPWVDERRHIEKSTRAALKHLEHLYRQFGSWELALAAYNGGSGHVSRAMESSGARTFWELIEKGALRAETAEYVPRFAALLVIYRNMDILGLEEELPPAAPTTRESITIPSSLGVDRVAAYAGIPVSTLKKLNPELNTTQPPPHGPLYTLFVPANSRKKLSARTALLAKARTGWENSFLEHRILPLLPLESITGRM